MSDDLSARPRTNTRAKAEAPPGMALSGEEGRKHIGRYEVVKTIGKGAMGVVYKARDPLLDRTVAVKTIMSPQQQGRRVRSAFLERFQREAKAAAKMSHPAIVTIFDVGVDEDSGAPFMVLEYLPGESLADRLDRVRLPLARCVQIGLDLSSALSFAHRQRIVHRDVKPANVLHAGDNRWKLADFGIARLPDSDLTQVGIFMGTPGYSPPEAIKEGRYTPQADVFAWGAVMYELMSGRIPYEGPDTKTTNGYVMQGNAPPPTRHDASIPEPLATVTMTALQPSDKARYRDASEAEQALREAWERCLTQGLVHPAVLAMDEIPHDKAPLRMHEPRGGNNRAAPMANNAPLNLGDSQEMTAINAKPPQKGFVIESTKARPGDDDPTKLMVREEGKGKGDLTKQGVGPSGRSPAITNDTTKEAAVRDSVADTKADPSVVRRMGGSSKLPWIIVAVVLVLAAAAVGLYFAGVLKL
ncbi:MAG TPA: serine/threonine-protein kinase [Kofleriaceae bacterium]|nr:serine/threonine-protein kinase [Kofleriaceae bacterium]